MLVDFLVHLSAELKREGLVVVPEQLCDTARYVFLSRSCSPEPGLCESLLPLLVTRIEDEPSYYRAWQRLLDEEVPSSQKLAFYDIIKGSRVSPDAPPRSELSMRGLKWGPWRQYLSYADGKSDQKQFEAAAMQALSREEDIEEWEKAVERELEEKFLDGENPAQLRKLLDHAMGFRKEFSTLKRRWNRVMTSLPLKQKTNPAPKVGEKKSLRPEFVQGYRANVQRWGRAELFLRPIEDIRESEILELQGPIREMAQRLRIRLEGMRRRASGKVDMRKTARLSYKTGGEPMRIAYLRPRRKPAKWLILSDVSGSVKHATRLFMSFLFELRQVMDEEIRGFVFVSKVQEITDILKEPHYQSMVRRIFGESEIDFRGYSDYGVAFGQFDALAGDDLDRETILLIIGDARNNRRHPRLDLLHKWSLKARKVIWFNPDLPEKWDQGDSIVHVYRRAIQQVYDVSTPGKLVSAIEQVVI